MPIAHTTVGAMAASQFRNNLIIILKGSSDYKEFPSKSLFKGPSDISALVFPLHVEL